MKLRIRSDGRGFTLHLPLIGAMRIAKLHLGKDARRSIKAIKRFRKRYGHFLLLEAESEEDSVQIWI